MYISGDTPMVLHIANPLTNSIARVNQVHILPKDIIISIRGLYLVFLDPLVDLPLCVQHLCSVALFVSEDTV